MDAVWARLGDADSAYGRWGVRVLDLTLGLVLAIPALLVGLPVALANAAIFRHPRRALYRQQRTGRHGVAFTITKFRTLAPGNEDDFATWLAGGDRARVTAFGRFLRASHLDELPQLWNILRGDMSFVGPRPEMVEIHAWASERVQGFHRRLAVRPGLTGLAQVTQAYAGGDTRAYRDKLAADLRWMRTRSLWGDLAILVRTAPTVLGTVWARRSARARVSAPDPGCHGG